MGEYNDPVDYETAAGGILDAGEDEDGEWCVPTRETPLEEGGRVWKRPKSPIRKLECRLRLLSSRLQGKVIGLES